MGHELHGFSSFCKKGCLIGSSQELPCEYRWSLPMSECYPEAGLLKEAVHSRRTTHIEEVVVGFVQSGGIVETTGSELSRLFMDVRNPMNETLWGRGAVHCLHLACEP